MRPVVCFEVLLTTIVAWAAVWGLLEEALSAVESKQSRCVLYGMMLLAAVAMAVWMEHVSVCALL